MNNLLPERSHTLTITRIQGHARRIASGEWMEVWEGRLHITRLARHLYGSLSMRLEIVGWILQEVTK